MLSKYDAQCTYRWDFEMKDIPQKPATVNKNWYIFKNWLLSIHLAPPFEIISMDGYTQHLKPFISHACFY